MDHRTLELVTAPVETKLVSLAKLKSDLPSLTASFTDDALNSVIDDCSSDIGSYLNQHADDQGGVSIGRQAVRETIFGCSGRHAIILGRRPIGAISSISENNLTSNRLIKGSDGAITSGLTTFSSAGASFTNGIVGKSITVVGAGASGADLTTTVEAFTDASTLELLDVAGTDVADASYEVENPSFLYSINKGRGTIAKTVGFNVGFFATSRVIVNYTCGWILPGQAGENLPSDIQSACVLHVQNKIEQLSNVGAGAGAIKVAEIEEVGRVEYAVNPADAITGISDEVMNRLKRYVTYAGF